MSYFSYSATHHVASQIIKGSKLGLSISTDKTLSQSTEIGSRGEGVAEISYIIVVVSVQVTNEQLL